MSETEPAFLTSTRASYDAVAAGYAELFRAELESKPLERAALRAFAEFVLAAGGGPVADLGCGPGRVTAYLNTLGVAAFGVDLSPRMVELARRAYPGLRFDEGSMTALDLPDASLGGIAAVYSIIHIPDEALPALFAEFHRVLAPGGELLLIFQVGDETVHRTSAFGGPVSLDIRRRRPEAVADLLAGAGLPVHARFHRAPDAGEPSPRAFLLARRTPEAPPH
ncbi:class I SAM-dependent methyltransferase [Kitasatospora paranensis]|uniref:Class I SAM-dependent methyltransferase n=1 Tax=Kitasatospora paranensis TaxID=258053 RepID=A0ABW2FTU3_9ACTN